MEQISEDVQISIENTDGKLIPSIDRLILLNDAECRQLLVEWDSSKKLCIHHLFEQQVQRTPAAVAVVFQDRQLTYQELNTQANQLASHLRSLGVTAETLVGICIDRSLDMLVGLLGILKAGGVYIPLDPTYPAERLAFMLADSQAAIIVTQQSLVEQLDPLLGDDCRVLVCMDSDAEIIATQSDENLRDILLGDNLAYIIYTSGSTGKPKGVQIAHQSLSNLLNSMQTALQVTASETFLAVTTISFDIAALELYLPLIVGAKLILVSRDTALDGNKLLAEIISSGATVMQSTPATWQMLVGCGFSTKHRLKQILSGGEALPRRLSHQLLAVSDEVWNVYGPTETTIWSSAYRVNSAERTLRERTSVVKTSLEPIGTAIANTELYVLDANLQPVEAGLYGELHIGGIGLARGYLNRPELTAEKFIPHPFRKEPGAKLYKTGDWVFCRSDGNLEYAERIDQQVKIRGFRIELGEIETALYNHPQVRETVVIPREDEPGNKRLVAYVVTTEAKAPSTSEFRQHLQQTLPDYMIPAVFVQLAALPLTPNCKIDRRALPVPQQTRLESADSFVAPRDKLESQLTEIWEEFLKIKPIGIRDNFFDLGGDSLLAMSLFVKIAEICQIQLPLSAIFQVPTIESLAKVLRSETSLPAWYSLVPIQPMSDPPESNIGQQSPLFIIHWLNHRELYQQLGFNRPIYGLHYGIADASDRVLTLPTIEDLATHYIKEMRDIQSQGPYYLVGHSWGGTIAYEMARQLVAQGHEVDLLALLDTYLEKSIWKVLPLTQKLGNVRQIGLFGLINRLRLKLENKSHIVNDDDSSSGLTHADLFIKYRLTSAAIDNYIPKPYSGRVILFQASNSCIPINYSVETAEVILKKFVTGSLEIHQISGDHHSILKHPNVSIVAATIETYIRDSIEIQANRRVCSCTSLNAPESLLDRNNLYRVN
jgi:amino acid adenylation domain-containing protein